MNKSAFSLRLRSASTALLASFAFAPLALAGNFIHTDSGPYDYNTLSNWSGGAINNTWGTSLTANQSITFAADTTLGSTTLGITNNSVFNHTFTGVDGARTITLAGNITLLNSATNANKVTFGSTTENQNLNIAMGASGRTFTAGTNRTLEMVNVISGSGGLTATGAGAGATLKLQGVNTFAGAMSLTSGIVVEVTKLANGGLDSSIGKSSNANGNLSFGGTSTATLRYVGTGDSTDRRFNIGGASAIFDASGTGAINWTNIANPTYSSATQARTITFRGISTHNNTMSAALNNSDGTTGVTSVLKDGIGTWIFAGANTYTGGTTVTEGTLATGATGTFGTGNITVANGAFLTSGNTTSFGDSATLTFSSTSTAASISLSSGTETIGAVYDSISATYLSAGTHNAAALNSFFSTSVFTGLGSLSVSAIPEPSTFALLAGGVGLVLASTRRQRRAA